MKYVKNIIFKVNNIKATKYDTFNIICDISNYFYPRYNNISDKFRYI